MSQYASADEFYADCGIPRARLEQGRNPVTPDDIERYLRAASGLLDSKVAMKYADQVPLQQWDDTVRLCVIGIAAWVVGNRIGLNPNEDGKAVKETADVWLSWLEKIRKGEAVLMGLSPTGIAPKKDFRAPDVAGPGLDLSACNWPPKGGREGFWG